MTCLYNTTFDCLFVLTTNQSKTQSCDIKVDIFLHYHGRAKIPCNPLSISTPSEVVQDFVELLVLSLL